MMALELGGNLLARAPPGRVARDTFWVLTFAERFESLAIAKLYAIWHDHGLFTTAVSTEVSGAADYTAATANFKIWNDLGSQSASLDPRAPTVRARIKPVL